MPPVGNSGNRPLQLAKDHPGRATLQPSRSGEDEGTGSQSRVVALHGQGRSCQTVCQLPKRVSHACQGTAAPVGLARTAMAVHPRGLRWSRGWENAFRSSGRPL